MSLLVPDSADFRVSSVLNNDRKQFGKKYIFDGKDETCWNSDQGSPQWIEIKFPDEKTIERLQIQFQGGFVGKECELVADENECGSDSNGVFAFYPKDSNTVQEFECGSLKASKAFKLIFRESTDFYGRITIYHLKIYGS